MASKPLTQCAHAGCMRLTKTRYCEHCKGKATADQQYRQTEQRKADNAFYKGKRWRQFRQYMKGVKPMQCVDCGNPGNQLDHIKPRKTHPELAFEETNVRWLCRTHHNAARKNQRM